MAIPIPIIPSIPLSIPWYPRQRQEIGAGCLPPRPGRPAPVIAAAEGRRASAAGAAPEPHGATVGSRWIPMSYDVVLTCVAAVADVLCHLGQ